MDQTGDEWEWQQKYIRAEIQYSDEPIVRVSLNPLCQSVVYSKLCSSYHVLAAVGHY